LDFQGNLMAPPGSNACGRPIRSLA
jgi:hypothetical protein